MASTVTEITLLFTIAFVSITYNGGLCQPATFSCDTSHTLIERRWQFSNTSCDIIKTRTADFYDLGHRVECQVQLGLPSIPPRVSASYVERCFILSNGTAKYEEKICCTEKINETRCFTCEGDPVQHDTLKGYHTENCNHDHSPQTCSAGEVCVATVNYTLASGSFARSVNKHCGDSVECQSKEQNNSHTCAHGLESPSCTYCCTDNLCNYRHPIVGLSPPPGPPPPICSNKCTGGNCTENANSTYGYDCDCLPGRWGYNCHLTMCNYYPCENGGVCVFISEPPYYTCDCRTGVSGENCTRALPKCQTPDYCLNGGTCYDHGTYGLRCLCSNESLGYRCEMKRPIPCGSERQRYRYSYHWSSGYRDYTNCTSRNQHYIDTANHYDYWVDHFCINYMKVADRPKFVQGVNGQITKLQSFNIGRCEAGDVRIFHDLESCCPFTTW